MSNERPYKRTDRVASEILSILGQIQTQYIDLSVLGFITFTHVSISKDLKNAKIFYSVVNNKKTMDKIDSQLNLKAKAFRKYLGQNLRIKFTPELKFFYDDTNSNHKISNTFWNQNESPNNSNNKNNCSRFSRFIDNCEFVVRCGQLRTMEPVGSYGSRVSAIQTPNDDGLSGKYKNFLKVEN